QALNAAVVNASGKAEAIAKGLGVTLKGAVNVQEISSGGPMVVRDTVDLAKTMEMADMAATPISTGELEISAMVSVQYSY
ncbi:MAG: SIMPL domain-containing protein, partial [Clostridiales bacterium]|nr:SIMPL domain-containing protein [Clostridiales bacterium]